MSEAPLAARDAYRAELTALAGVDRRILCLEADLGGKNHPFQAAYPARFRNVGIAEGAMIDMAAALAVAGYRPFVSTFATFAAMRAAESLKLSLGYLGAPVTVVAPYAGVSGGWFGTTHHCLEDLAVVGALPGIVIAAPYGEQETRAVIRERAGSARPGYVRLGRNAAHHSLPYPGSTNGAPVPPVVWQGTPDGDRCLVSAGEYATQLCVDAVGEVPGLAHAHLCYLDEAHLRQAAAELAGYRELVVVEEHRGWGGVGGALATLLPEVQVRSVTPAGWPVHGGSAEDVAAELGLDLPAVLRALTQSAPDLSAPDLSAPDLSAPDLSAPDLSAPDLSAPDLSAPDLATPDLSAPDLPARRAA
jgi:transketolase